VALAFWLLPANPVATELEAGDGAAQPWPSRKEWPSGQECCFSLSFAPTRSLVMPHSTDENKCLQRNRKGGESLGLGRRETLNMQYNTCALKQGQKRTRWWRMGRVTDGWCHGSWRGWSWRYLLFQAPHWTDGETQPPKDQSPH
jgi:hypothetical protein